MRRLWRLTLVLLGILMTLAGCDASKPSAPIPRKPTTQPFYVVDNIPDSSVPGGYHTAVVALSPQNGSILWRYQIAGQATVLVVEMGGAVYVGSSDYPYPGIQPGFLDALDPASGVLRWRHETSRSLTEPPIVANGVVYLTYGAVPLTDTPFYTSGFIEAISAHDGKSLWKAQAHGSSSSVALASGTLYVTTSLPLSTNGFVVALDVRNGKTLWTAPIDWSHGGSSDPKATAPTVANGIVYVEANAVNAFSATDGHLIWRYLLPPFASPLTVVNGEVYLDWHAHPNGGQLPNTAIALDAATGHVRWSYELLGNLSSPLVVDGMVYLSVNSATSTPRGRIVALRASDGVLVWQTPGVLLANDDLFGPPAESGNDIAVLEANITDGKFVLSLLRGQDGSRIWSHDISGIIESLPLVSQGGVLYVYADTNDAYSLLAFRASDGTLLWRHSFTE